MLFMPDIKRYRCPFHFIYVPEVTPAIARPVRSSEHVEALATALGS